MDKIELPVIGMLGGMVKSEQPSEDLWYPTVEERDNMLRVLADRVTIVKRQLPLILYNLDSEQDATVSIVQEGEDIEEVFDIPYYYAVVSLIEEEEDDCGACFFGSQDWKMATTKSGTVHKIPVGHALLMKSDTGKRWGAYNLGYSGHLWANIIRCDKSFALGGRCSGLSGGSQDVTFSGLFKGNATLLRVSWKFLFDYEPSDYAFAQMFMDCTSLEEAPDLSSALYAPMEVYAEMFKGCTSLSEAPELPARRVSDEVPYYGMFEGCSKIRYVRALFENDYCVMGESWLRAVAPRGALVISKKNGMTRESLGVPEGWDVYKENDPDAPWDGNGYDDTGGDTGGGELE